MALLSAFYLPATLRPRTLSQKIWRRRPWWIGSLKYKWNFLCQSWLVLLTSEGWFIADYQAGEDCLSNHFTLHTQLEKNKHSKMFPFYGLMDGTFSSKIVTSIFVIYCGDQGQVQPISRPQTSSAKWRVQSPSFSTNTMKAAVQGYLW